MIKSNFKILLLFLLMFFLSPYSYAQNIISEPVKRNFELSGGLGLPELINAGVKYGGRSKIGINAGIWPHIGGGVTTSYNLELYFHIAESKKKEQVSWFFNTGLSRVLIDNKDPLTDIIVITRFGRIRRYNKRDSGEIYFGGIFLLEKIPADDNFPERLSVLFIPSLSLGFMINLQKNHKSVPDSAGH